MSHLRLPHSLHAYVLLDLRFFSPYYTVVNSALFDDFMFSLVWLQVTGFFATLLSKSESLFTFGKQCLDLVKVVWVLTVFVVFVTVSSKAIFLIAMVTSAVSKLMSVGAASETLAPISNS